MRKGNDVLETLTTWVNVQMQEAREGLGDTEGDPDANLEGRLDALGSINRVLQDSGVTAATVESRRVSTDAYVQYISTKSSPEEVRFAKGEIVAATGFELALADTGYLLEMITTPTVVKARV